MSDREVRAQIRAGALDAEALAARCDAGTRCGGCRPVIEAILSESGVVVRRATVAA